MVVLVEKLRNMSFESGGMPEYWKTGRLENWKIGKLEDLKTAPLYKGK